MGAGARVPGQADDGDAVDRGVGLAVSASVESVLVGAAREGRRGDAAEHREGRRGTEPGSVLAGGDQQLPGDIDANAMELQDIGIDRGDQRARIGIEAVDLLAQVAVAAGQEMQRLLEGGLGLGKAFEVGPGRGAAARTEVTRSALIWRTT